LDVAWPGSHIDRLDWRERIAAIEAEAAERCRYGWCCDMDFDNGTYRTGDCIGRTRNADAVEQEAARLERERIGRRLRSGWLRLADGRSATTAHVLADDCECRLLGCALDPESAP